MSLTYAKVNIQIRHKAQPQDMEAAPPVKPVGLSEPYIEFPPGLFEFSTVEPEPPATSVPAPVPAVVPTGPVPVTAGLSPAPKLRRLQHDQGKGIAQAQWMTVA